MVSVRAAREDDLEGCLEVDCAVIGDDRRAPFLKARIEQDRLYVAEVEGRIVGLIAYETEWIGQFYVSLVCVHPDYRKRGVARRLFAAVEGHCKTGRLFSSTEEDNQVSIKMHERLGFQRSGYIDNLPQPTREIIYFKRVEPRPQ